MELHYTQIGADRYLKISDSDALRPFFMSIVSDSDHWMFISSNGGLSAGRKNADYALFPYYTDDKITESAETNDNPVKQNTFSPGHHIPVYPSSALYEKGADVVAILAWTYAAPIMARHQAFAERGGKFVIPLPGVVVH